MATQAHPYQLRASAELIQAMQELRNQPNLATNAQQALDTLLNDHTRFQHAGEHIQTYLTDVGQAWKQHQNLQEIAQEFSSQNIRLEDIDSYSQWKERALRLAVVKRQRLTRQSLAYSIGYRADRRHSTVPNNTITARWRRPLASSLIAAIRPTGLAALATHGYPGSSTTPWIFRAYPLDAYTH